MSNTNIHFKLISLDVSESRNYENRKSIFLWLSKQCDEFCFVVFFFFFFFEETYSKTEIKTFWKLQWKGEIYFVHGIEHSRGVIILTKEGLYIKMNESQLDPEGRFIFLDTTIQDSRFRLIYIYEPNKVKDQKVFFESSNNFFEQIDCSLVLSL